MARKKKKKKNKKGGPSVVRKFFGGLSGGLADDTKHSIYAVIFFVLAALFILASFGVAGKTGAFLFSNLEKFLGIGFFLLPLLCILLGLALLRSVRPDFALPSSLGGLIFILSGLGLLSTLFPTETGGYLGSHVSAPLVYAFATPLTVIMLGALLFISLLLIFDTRPELRHLFFWRKEKAEEDEEDAFGADEIIAGSDVEEDTPDEAPVKEETEAKENFAEKTKKAFLRKKDDEEAYEEELHKFSTRDLDDSYTPPPLSLLSKDKGKPGMGDIKANTNAIKRTLRNFGIIVEMDEVSVGPTVTRYALKPAEGVKLSRITNLQNELALALAAQTVRIEAPIPKTSLVGIEIPNNTKSMVGLGSILSAKEFENSPLPLLTSFGKGISGKPLFSNLAKMPHLLIAGTTGSGKSVSVHALIASLLYRNGPSNLRFIMVDPKRVELTLYNGIPHLLSPVITEPKKAVLALKWLAKEMNRRYDILESHSVRDISSYHENVLAKELEKQKKRQENGEDIPEEEQVERMPYIVVLIDELSDIMQVYPRELESGIVRLAQMSRAVGIHLVLSTQRPSVNVITGLIKANIPARVALQVASQVDSRTILDRAGAEKLLGAGDMLFLSGEMSRATRLQGAAISENEVKAIVKHLKKQADGTETDELAFTEEGGEKSDVLFSAKLDEDDEEDSLYEEAREVVVNAGKASTSYLQRKLRVGYSRAARLMDILEERGVIGPANGSKPREVLEGQDEGYGRDDEASV